MGVRENAAALVERLFETYADIAETYSIDVPAEGGSLDPDTGDPVPGAPSEPITFTGLPLSPSVEELRALDLLDTGALSIVVRTRETGPLDTTRPVKGRLGTYDVIRVTADPAGASQTLLVRGPR